MESVTIITASLNAEAFIRSAIESVRLQKGPIIEHLLIDGGSTDHTLKVAEEMGVRCISAPGANIYRSWQIGVEMSKANHLLFLNADDFLASGILSAFQHRFSEKPSLDAISSRAVVVEGNELRAMRVLRNFSRTYIQEGHIEIGDGFMNSTCFTKSSILEAGGFDENFFISGDKDFIIRYIQGRPHVDCLNRFGMFVRSHPGSKTFGKKKEFNEEMISEGLVIAERYDQSFNKDTRKFCKRLKGKRLLMRWSNRLKRGGVRSLLRAIVMDGAGTWIGVREVPLTIWSKVKREFRFRFDREGCSEILETGQEEALWMAASASNACKQKNTREAPTGAGLP